jgi:hypothetical protein
MFRSGLQYRDHKSGDRRFLSHTGDLAHNMSEIAYLVEKGIYESPFANELCKFYNLTKDELLKAFTCYLHSLRLAVAKSGMDFKTTLKVSGWLSLQPKERMAIMALFGQTLMGIQQVRVREAKAVGGRGLPGSSPIDDALKFSDLDVVAAMFETAPTEVKDFVDLDAND